VTGATTRRRPRASRAAKPTRSRFLVVTGMSGAGKSHAIRALEDLGYYCVDNLPTPLIPVMADLSLRHDVDNPLMAPVWRALSARRSLRPVLVFLEASDAVLLRRFSETRRPHPLAPDRPVAEALAEERRILAPIRRLADAIIDTSDLTVHELRQILPSIARETNARAPLIVTFESFGFKHGVPLDADLVFDCRFLPNPHFVPGLRRKTGKDRAVVQYMTRHTVTGDFERRLESFLEYVVPHYVAEGKTYLTVGIGCTGGRHRSVYLAERLKRRLSKLARVTTRVRHRDLAGDTP
jgi:UPF0042 nucleotide-binding protein